MADDAARSPHAPWPDLPQLQRWFQAVVTHPGGVLEGAASAEAAAALVAKIGEVAEPSSRQSAQERMAVYAQAYWARLLECLREEFPIVRATAGDAAFDMLAVGYLAAYPSRSYTLGRLSDKFAEYLASSAAQSDEELFGPFLAELARLEQAVNETFDAPGGETLGYLQAEALRQIPANEQAAFLLELLPTVRLLAFDFDVQSFYTAARRDPQQLPEPARQPCFVALSRRAYVVRRLPLTPVQFAILAAIQTGRNLGEALNEALQNFAGDAEMPDVGVLAAWFAEWAEAGLFQRLGD
jgi:hypothetical protein